MVLFSEPSAKTFVGGKCALPSALLVISYFGFRFLPKHTIKSLVFRVTSRVEVFCHKQDSLMCVWRGGVC